MPISVLFSVVALILAIILVRSIFGLWIAGLLVIAALVYGRKAVANQVAHDHTWHALDRLRTLTGIEFERHVAELYRRLGYRVEMTRGSGDQGIDVIAQSSNERIGIQCKQWADAVGNSGVQEAIAGRVYYNCSRVAVVCTSSYTASARELAARGNVDLIDGTTYAGMVNQFQALARPVGIAAWTPRGRAGVLQAAMFAFALIVFVLHFSFQGAGIAVPQLSTQPAAYNYAASTTYSAPTTAPYMANTPEPAPFADTQQQAPLAPSEVLPLLRATSALTVSTNTDGFTAYVTVPGTRASGTANANRVITGQLADGRWVAFVPLASGSPSTGDIYSLMWVWTNGQARFVGEIPAENNGLGQLSTSIRNGEIYISWPVCCPRAIHTSVNTLDGIRFRLLSETNS